VYLVFVFFNLLGVKIAATLEMVIAVLAVVELLVFVGVFAPSF
jgi:ethanolamine permease